MCGTHISMRSTGNIGHRGRVLECDAIAELSWTMAGEHTPVPTSPVQRQTGGCSSNWRFREGIKSVVASFLGTQPGRERVVLLEPLSSSRLWALGCHFPF